MAPPSSATAPRKGHEIAVDRLEGYLDAHIDVFRAPIADIKQVIFLRLACIAVMIRCVHDYMIDATDECIMLCICHCCTPLLLYDGCYCADVFPYLQFSGGQSNPTFYIRDSSSRLVVL